MDSTGTAGTTSRFQHYKLLRRPDGTPWELGRGTMGVTYKAFDVNLRCEVALKVVNPALIHHPNARERFIREARAAARLRHRNIASVYHLGNDGDRFFYAMEFIDGETLDALVRRQGPLSPGAALGVLLQVARALAAAARQGVIHRDIKPGNLMVVHEDDDDHRVVKLIDFGLARAVAADDEPGNLTAHGFVGTPVYSSPEQMAEKPADARSDIYSLGVTAWFLLVGRPPFNGTVASIFQQHATKPPPWDALPASIPAPVRTLLARMLEKDPDKRPQSAVELRQEIDLCKESLVAPRPAAPPLQPPTPSPRPDAPRTVQGPPREIGPGMILKGRYELLRLVGEGNSGRVFQVRDRAANDAPRALKLLRPEVTGDTSGRQESVDEIALIQGAPHPSLIRLHAFERLEARGVDFLVEEWLRGFTLRDLLAIRGGTLPAAEALGLLAQAAGAADHAAARGFHRLDLALHQLHLHFPTLPASADDLAPRATMGRPLAEWPRWVLKINPFGASPDGLESSTWAGEVTHLPGAIPRDRIPRSETPADPPAVGYLRGLARLVYEILGGAPAVADHGPDNRPRYVSLPALGERANAVLQAALTEEPPAFPTSQAFYAALAEAAGQRALPATVPGPDTEDAPLDRSPRRPPRPAVWDDWESPAPALPPAALADPASESSAWARLTQVPAPRRDWSWLPTALVGVLVLVGAIVVFAAITHRKPPVKTTLVTPTPRPAVTPSIVAAARPSATPHLAPSLAPSAPPTPREVPLLTPVATIPIPADSPQGTPPPLSPTPAPRDTLVKVRVETKPSGAEVRLAGKLLGTTPLETSLPPGDHALVARYRNWPEVHHVLHLDSSQLSALDEIRMIPPTMIPTAEPLPSSGLKNRRPPTPAPRREPPRPSPAATPSSDGLIYFPTPAASAPTPTPARGLEPFLSTPPRVRRARPVPSPTDLDGGSQPDSRRRSNPDALDSGDED